MANVFSTQFFAGIVPNTLTTLFTVPSGYVAVVRNVTAFGAGIALQPLNGFQLYTGGVIFYGWQSPYPRGGVQYNEEFRVVIPTGGLIQGVSHDASFASWEMTISGYLLTLP